MSFKIIKEFIGYRDSYFVVEDCFFFYRKVPQKIYGYDTIEEAKRLKEYFERKNKIELIE